MDLNYLKKLCIISKIRVRKDYSETPTLKIPNTYLSKQGQLVLIKQHPTQGWPSTKGTVIRFIWGTLTSQLRISTNRVAEMIQL